MNLGSRIGQWLVARFGTPAPSQAPPATAAPEAPAQIYVREAPKQSMVSRKALLAASGLFVVAFWIAAHAMHSSPTSPTPAAQLSSAAAVDRTRVQHIIEDLNRKNADLALVREEARNRLQSQMQSPSPPPMYPGYGAPPAAPTPAKPLAEEKKERAYKSLFTSPVVMVKADTGEGPSAAPLPDRKAKPAVTEASAAPPLPPTAPSEPGDSRRDCVDLDRGGEQLYALCEGTIIEARLENRLVGDLAGPVNAIVERDMYSRDRQHLLMPKGSKLLGRASRADQAFQERLAVQFHRMLLPDGRGVDLHDAAGLDQAGEMALKDKTNRHIPATVATSVALGSLAAFSQFGTGAYLNANGVDLYRQSLATQAGQTGQQLLGRNLYRPPSITIREGHPVEIYLNADIHLPEFRPALELRYENGGRQ
jgi:type IV secretion system protein VirB10